MTWLVLHEADTNTAAQTTIMSRAPLLESQLPGKPAFVDLLRDQPAPRLMNTHLQARFLAPALEKGRAKVIVVLRNPKDLVVSYYHFYKTRPGRAIPDFDEFFHRLVML